MTDNPSSRNAIQLLAVQAEDGNVDQMLYRIEDKGRDYGSYVRAGAFRWFVRETGKITLFKIYYHSDSGFEINDIVSANGRRRRPRTAPTAGCWCRRCTPCHSPSLPTTEEWGLCYSRAEVEPHRGTSFELFMFK